MNSEWHKKKRVAVFAHYDKDNIIDDYVIYYLNALKEITQKIIFVSSCDLGVNETDKISNVVDKIILENHGEYDFGSYKRGFLFALKNELLKDIDELIFVNDSCYGPFNSLLPIFNQMETQDSDFWGITQNQTGLIKENDKYFACKKPHIQSYFLVFKQNVFLSEAFMNFINTVKKEEKRQDVIIKYEIGISEVLFDAGFIGKSFIDVFADSYNLILYKWKELLLQYNMPFLKGSLAKLDNMDRVTVDNYKKVIKKISDYPVELIEKHVRRVSSNKDFLFFVPGKVRPFFYKIIYYMVNRIKKLSFKKSENSYKK